MNFRIVKNLAECEKLWNKFSPKKTLWDLWQVVFSFYNPEINAPFFIVLVKNGKDDGLLPLWYDSSEECYYFFGGEYPENRRFWFDLSFFNDVIKQIPEHFNMFEINKNEIGNIPKDVLVKIDYEFETSTKRYFLDVEKFGYDIESYLKTFNKKHRKNLRYDLKQLEKLNYNLVFEQNEHFDDFVMLSVKRFGNDSDLSDGAFVGQMRQFVRYLSENNMLHTISIEIEGKIQGIEFAAVYNNVYYVLNGASNPEIENLGKLLIMSHIKNAIKLKAKEVDFLSSETGGWKKLWNCEEEEYYDY